MLHKQFIRTLILITAVCGITFSQKSVDKVKAVCGDLPDEMKQCCSVEITVTVTNTGTNTWSSSKLSTKVTGGLSLIGTTYGGNGWVLEPGQSQTLVYKLTAPNSTGKKKCKVYFYSDMKKIGTKQKTINVVGD